MCLFLTIEQVVALHDRVAPGAGLRDAGLLAAGVIRPQTSAFGEDAYPLLHDKAAALLHSLARTQPFVDGNKRTALAALEAFLNLNGWELDRSVRQDQLLIVHLIEDVAQDLYDMPKIVEWLVDHTTTIPYGGDLE